MRLLVLKELVPSVGLVNALGLIGEEDGVAVEGDAQLSLRHFRHLLLAEHGGCCYAWMNCKNVYQYMSQSVHQRCKPTLY